MPVRDSEVEGKYGDYIMEHTGVRRLAADSISGFDPEKKEFLEEIMVEEDLPEFETSMTTASAFKLKHGDKVSLRRIPGTESCMVRIKRGACIMVPKARPFQAGMVAGILPDGWSAVKYGVPEDLAQQLDPGALFTLCCVAEVFYSAGMPDPMEIFSHIHLSEFGNFLGSSMGGALKTKNLYRDIYLEKSVQSDVLADFYPNTASAWADMLLIGAAGPIKTPVGACATSVESIDSGFDSIMQRKTKMCLVGGFDDLQEDEAYGFSMLNATANTAEELARGRLPSEISRPAAESRAGFVEAQGCGIQLICRADVAVEMGLPIYGVIAGSAMAGDKIGRSVPAPGQGMLTFARETAATKPRFPKDWRYVPLNLSASSFELAQDSSSNTSGHDSDWDHVSDPVFSSSSGIVSSTPLTFVDGDSIRSLAMDKGDLGHSADSSMSPMRAALAAYNLTVDDINVASLHGTSTKAGDINEADVISKQMHHLGRNPNRPMWTVCQKSVTGHPKAPAAAWMLNGCLQMMDSGIVPANRNADNVDPAWQSFRHIVVPKRPIHLPQMKAFMLTSFGFGQKGGQVIGVAPKYLFAMLDEQTFMDYRGRFASRSQRADRSLAKALMENKIVKVLDKPPYRPEDADHVLMNPCARASFDISTQAYRFEVGPVHCF